MMVKSTLNSGGGGGGGGGVYSMDIDGTPQSRMVEDVNVPCNTFLLELFNL